MSAGAGEVTTRTISALRTAVAVAAVEAGRGVPNDDSGLPVELDLAAIDKLKPLGAGALGIPIMDGDSLSGMPECFVKQKREAAFTDAAFLGENGKVHGAHLLISLHILMRLRNVP
jgi:hypothetical protein